MRKYSLIKEYRQSSLNGTFNMHEKTNFLCGKGMDIQDEIRLSSISATTGLDKYDDIKKLGIKSIEIEKNQTQQEKDNLTKWKLTLDGNLLLTEYLYHEIYTDNYFSVFKGINDNIVKNKKTNIACYDYIRLNLLDRYKIKEVILWATYYDLKLGFTPGTEQIQLLKQTPVYDFSAKPTTTPDDDKQTVSVKTYTDGIIEVDYKQTKTSQQFTFLYYFDIIFIRA